MRAPAGRCPGIPAADAVTLTADDDVAEYSELLTRRLRPQDSFEVYMARAMPGLLDSDSLSRWLTNRWPVASQTCGEPLGTKAGLSADGLTKGNQVLVSMHRSACRPLA